MKKYVINLFMTVPGQEVAAQFELRTNFNRPHEGMFLELTEEQVDLVRDWFDYHIKERGKKK